MTFVRKEGSERCATCEEERCAMCEEGEVCEGVVKGMACV